MYYSFPSRHSNGYQIELNHFIDVVKGLEAPSVTGKMTQAVTKIATACEESAKSGKPVQIKWDKEEIPEGYVMA
jgi:myo-inositol 2-dehydrogenase/D-chiro-inositol 1-dehydrogenase